MTDLQPRSVAGARGVSKPLPLTIKIFLMVSGVVLVAITLVGALAAWAAALSVERSIGQHNLRLARMIASLPQVKAGFMAPEPTAVLQPLAEQFRHALRTDLIVMFDMNRVRLTHYDPRYIGTLYDAGDEGPALAGHEHISRCSCVGVQSVRGLAPVFAPDGHQVGVVVVGTFVDNVAVGIRQVQFPLYGALVLAILVAAAGAAYVAGNIRRTLYGLEPAEISALFQERETMLRSIREGLIATDRSGRITLVNNTAREIVGRDDLVGLEADAVVPDLRLGEVLAGVTPQEDEELVIGRRVVVCNRTPVAVGGQIVGALATFRDKTEVARLAQELTGVRRFAEALRAQNHEFMNRLQTVAGLIHLGAHDEAIDFIARVTRQRQETVQFLLANVRDAATSGILLGKLSEAQEKGIDLILSPDTRLSGLPPHFDSTAMVCVLGNLIENAIEALAGREGGPRRVVVSLGETKDALTLVVEDTGPGIPTELLPHIFRPGVSTKTEARGLGLYLARSYVIQAGGTIWAESGPGGARFCVRIPLQVPEPAGAYVASLLSS